MTKLINALTLALIVALGSTADLAAQDSKAKAKATEKGEPKAKAGEKRDTYPLYGKVVAITSRTLTIVRSDSPDAKEAKYTMNSATEIVNGEKAATVEDVEVGKWIGGLLKKAEADGNDVVMKINIAAKQKAKGKAPAKGKAKAEASSSKKGES